jgi:hypothetical protein
VSTTPKGNPAQNAPIGLAATVGPRTEFNRRREEADVRSSLSNGGAFPVTRTNQAVLPSRPLGPSPIGSAAVWKILHEGARSSNKV